jgi:hypothetical protein
MRRVAFVLSCILFATGVVAVRAQAVPSATTRRVSITAGGMASVFQPNFAGDWTFVCTSSCTTAPTGFWYPVAASSDQPLFGVGAYVDVKFSRWVQLEAEGRWQRFNQYDNIHQDNYLIGPRVPIYHFWKSTVYAKTLAGFSNMTVGPDSLPGNHGTFTDIAFGGGMDIKMTKRLSLRLPDVEYQYWPKWGNSTLSPFGASVGIGYKIF